MKYKQIKYEEWFFQSDYDLETAAVYVAGRTKCLLHIYMSFEFGKSVERCLSANKRSTTMDQAAIIPNLATVYEIIGYMQTALQKNGVKSCHIALFGSFFHGNNHKDSDMDIIVISESFEGRDISERINMTLNAQYEVRKRYVVPMDILLKTPQEYKNQEYIESKIIV
jgi:predicted nucleotidyltransferase